jgi:hypothetical protein
MTGVEAVLRREGLGVPDCDVAGEEGADRGRLNESWPSTPDTVADVLEVFEPVLGAGGCEGGAEEASASVARGGSGGGVDSGRGKPGGSPPSPLLVSFIRGDKLTPKHARSRTSRIEPGPSPP